jgi:hypothetical protein
VPEKRFAGNGIITIIAKPPCNGVVAIHDENGIVAIVVEMTMSENAQNALAEDDLDLIIGDIPIAEFLFRDRRKRRLVRRLMGELPIFELGGKRVARRSRLSAAIIERERANRAGTRVCGGEQRRCEDHRQPGASSRFTSRGKGGRKK